jgi:tetratricopeptide (TPR) repeat protein
MPTVVNGIGTWYYGKRRSHTRKGTCEFCGNLTTLTSYDTTLFFVVFFIPVIPLSRKRILEQCAACQQHRVLSLAQWEEGKTNDGVAILERVRNAPNDREAVLQAIGMAQWYQDEPLFNQVVEPIASEHRGDAAIQTQLGQAYAYFARWEQAEQAYRAALAVEDNQLTREGLAWALLKQGRPREARPFFQHILGGRRQDGAGSIYFLIKGYQAEGLHDEALALMDERDQAFPDLVHLKEYRKQRKLSTRYEGTSKRIRSSFLDEGGKTGYRHGNWTARLPRWIAAFLLLGALTAYFGSAIWIGLSRKVFLVNGTGRAYTVSIAGQEHALQAQSATPLRVSEGLIEVRFQDAKLGLKPLECAVESSFWTRPFASHTFVINPDQTAVLLEQELIYAQNPPPGKPPQVLLGKGFYHFSGLDYEFQEFPATLQVPKNGSLTKRRVALAPMANAEARMMVMARLPSDQEQIEFCERLLRIDPNNAMLLYVLASRFTPERMLEFLKVHLDDRPPHVEWHRMYQSFMERSHPEIDLRPQYQQLVTETKGEADAVYLLGRADPDPDRSEKVLREAADATPPSAYAMSSLGYRALCEGRFTESVGWFEKALPRLAEKATARPFYYDALLAKGDYDRLLSVLQTDAQLSVWKQKALTDMAWVHAVRGDKEKARKALAQAIQAYPEQLRPSTQQTLEGWLCCWENDVAGFLKKASSQVNLSFEVAFLQGDLKKAAELAGRAQHDAGIHHGLLYLAAQRSRDKELADSQWGALLAGLKKGGRDERAFAELLTRGKLETTPSYRRLAVEPRSKRVLLAVLAQRYQEQAREVLPLARKLDFQHDAVSLCLRKVWPDAK